MRVLADPYEGPVDEVARGVADGADQYGERGQRDESPEDKGWLAGVRVGRVVAIPNGQLGGVGKIEGFEV